MKNKIKQFFKPEPLSIEDQNRFNELIERRNEINKTFPNFCTPINKNKLLRQKDRSIAIIINHVFSGHVLDLINAGFKNPEYVAKIAEQYTQNEFIIVDKKS